MLGRLRQKLFGISLEETTVARRGFQVSDDGVRQNLEKIGRIFVQGYHAALGEDHPDRLAAYLNREVPLEYQGFAFEGAGMGLALLDILSPWRKSRAQALADGPGNNHYYMIHVGIGWALARMHRRVDRTLKRLDPVVRWLVVEGYGFHEGYFHWPRVIEQQERPNRLNGYAHRAFDQGIGRCLWFVKGADVGRISDTIEAFPSGRHADIWSGVGLACCYAGGVDAATIRSLADATGAHQGPFAQGVAFAAEARHRAGNPVAHAELACQVLWGLPLEQTARIVKEAETGLPLHGPEPGWEIWRQRTQAQFKKTKEAIVG